MTARRSTVPSIPTKMGSHVLIVSSSRLTEADDPIFIRFRVVKLSIVYRSCFWNVVNKTAGPIPRSDKESYHNWRWYHCSYTLSPRSYRDTGSVARARTLHWLPTRSMAKHQYFCYCPMLPSYALACVYVTYWLHPSGRCRGSRNNMGTSFFSLYSKDS